MARRVRLSSTSRPSKRAFARASTICDGGLNRGHHVFEIADKFGVLPSAKVPLRTLRGCPASTAIFRAPLGRPPFSTRHLRAHHPNIHHARGALKIPLYRRRYLHSIADPHLLIRRQTFPVAQHMRKRRRCIEVVDIKEQRPRNMRFTVKLVSFMASLHS